MDNRTIRDIGWIVFAVAIYYIIGRLSINLLFQPEDIAAVWPASGIFLSAIILTRKKLRPYIAVALFITDFIIEMQAGSTIILSLLYAFALTFDAILSAWFLFRFIGETPTFDKVKQVFLFIIFSVIISNALAATIAAFGPYVLFKIPFWNSWKLWWSSDAVGNLLVTPLILSWAYLFRKKVKQEHTYEFLALLVSMAIVNFIALKTLNENVDLFSFLNFLTFPFLIWAAIRFGVKGVATASLILTIGVLYFIQEGQLRISSADSSLNMIIIVQLYLAIISISSLFLASIVAERKKAEEVLNENEEKFRSIFENSPVGKSITGFDGSIRTNKAFSEMLGYSFEEFQLKNWKEITHPDDLQLSLDVLESIINGEKQTAQLEKRYIHKNGSTVYTDVRTTLQKDHNGRALFLITTISDITERKMAEILLKDKSDEIEAQNEEYLQINEELNQINQELTEAKERAEESDRLKTAFLQNMSHEIRTPMNAIMGFSELMVQNFDSKSKLLEFSNIINLRCYDLLNIINDILDIAKIESGQLRVTNEECSLTDLFVELTTFFQATQARDGKKQIEFSLHAFSESSQNFVVTDKVKLRQIFINLINNAFKFTDNGKIEGGCKSISGNYMIFYVSDTGLGIPADKQEFIFERFSQLNLRPDKLIGGTGLGLAITKGLVELLGGKIWLESELGKGTTFNFSLPYQKTASKHPEITSIVEKSIFTFPDKKILVVEDDIYNAAYIKEVLTETGINIIHTQFGNQAVQIALTQSPDIIIMDIQLPDITGYEAVRQIKEYNPAAKIIAQTAYAFDEDRRQAINAGCIDYISKPLNRDLLLEKIKIHLG